MSQDTPHNDRLLARYARGSVRLQTGRYVTAEEKAKRRDAVFAMDFTPPEDQQDQSVDNIDKNK